jgi:2-C-methyl-D-erythritol 4-phosphate cytidylyltransferase / 2-C-methyl-D-erythritol 2,4-cyclodiphosphate synthase
MAGSTPFVAVVVAAGSSTRMGTDKLWIEFWGRPTWRWALDTLLAAGAARVALVVPAAAIDRFRDCLPPDEKDRCLVVGGGDARAESVVAGLRALGEAGHDDTVLTLVHDAARPAVSAELVRAVVAEALTTGDAVVPVVPLRDSLKRVRGGRVVAPVDRDDVVAAQTPQAARLGVLRAALEEARAWKRPVTDDVAALSGAGVSVRTVPGDPSNRKLTEPGDVDALRGVLGPGTSPIAPPGTAADVPAGVRCGIGFDAHRLVKGREMRIGGVLFADADLGPEGHSDGDAALHALIDALLGGAQLGDIGSLFPPDAAWEGADSRDLARRAVARLAENGWRPTAADVAVAVAHPPIGPRRDEIIAAVADVLGIDADAVSVKGTTSDGLGFAGSEGIAAWAVAGVTRIE